MMQSWKWALAAGAVLVAVPAAILVPEARSPAADHLDPPLRTDILMGDPTPDVPADIADVFVWEQGGKVLLGLTTAGPGAQTSPGTYDRDVLYTINVSNDGNPNNYEIRVKFRFGEDTSKPGNQWGVKVEGLPGVTGDIIGPIMTDLSKDGVKVRAGIFDDPFFFDVLGFRASRSTGVLVFNNQRDFFFGQNDTGIIIEIPRERVIVGGNRLDVWATSARFGGNI